MRDITQKGIGEASGVFLFAMKMCDEKSTEERLSQIARIYCEKIGKETGAEEEWAVGRTEKGKPYFVYHPEVQFSVSHSGEWWICAMGDIQVGVDVQRHALLRGETKEQAVLRFQKIAHRFFHPAEVAYIEEDALDFQRFFRVWAARESYVKYTGQGIDARFSEYCLIPEGFEEPKSEGWMAEDVWIREIPFKDTYTLCVCAPEMRKIEEIVIYV